MCFRHRINAVEVHEGFMHSLQYLAGRACHMLKRHCVASSDAWCAISVAKLFFMSRLHDDDVYEFVTSRVLGESAARLSNKGPMRIFTDGVIWKISNPEVRKDLFAHVQAPTS